ncbi:MAG: SDR family oxidoreductase, partial [Bacteroidota bacterium]
MIKKIAVIGATGMLGRPVTLELLSAGFEVTALVRNEEKAIRKLPAEINLIHGNIKILQDLEHVFAGQDAAYISLNLRRGERKKDFHAETDGLKLIIQAAQKTKLKRIAFISSLVMNYQGMNNFNWWVFEMKKEAIRMIKLSGIPYTIFYPSTFMENFEATYRRGNKLMLAGRSESRMYFIAAHDYGKQVARSFKILKNGTNKEYPIQGPEPFTADEGVAEYIKHYRKTQLSVSKAPLGLLKFIGRFSATINYGANIVEALNRYHEKFEAENTWNELGKPA